MCFNYDLYDWIKAQLYSAKHSGIRRKCDYNITLEAHEGLSVTLLTTLCLRMQNFTAFFVCGSSPMSV